MVTVAHEINNPLAGLQGMISGLVRVQDLPTNALRHLQTMAEAARRIKQTLRNLERLRSDRIKQYTAGIKMIDWGDKG